jgi:hypothetical protein
MIFSMTIWWEGAERNTRPSDAPETARKSLIRTKRDRGWVAMCWTYGVKRSWEKKECSEWRGTDLTRYFWSAVE